MKFLMTTFIVFAMSKPAWAFDQNVNCTPQQKGASIKGLKISGSGDFPTIADNDKPVTAIVKEITLQKKVFKDVKLSGSATGSPRGPTFTLTSENSKDIKEIFIGVSDGSITNSKDKTFDMNCSPAD